MSQAILISGNEVINSLYEVNLRAYVATNVTIKENLEQALDLIKLSPNIDAIICFRELNEKDNAIDKLHEYLGEAKLKIPVVVLGAPTAALHNSIVIKNKYDIAGLLKAMAKILEITAKDMAQREVPKYFPIPLKLFLHIEKSHCDIFYRNEDENFEFNYFKIVEKDIPIDNGLEKYTQAGVEHLYINAIERLRFINKTSKAIVGELQRDDLTLDEKVEITEQVMGIVAEEIFENPRVSKELAEISKACIDSISEVLNSVPKIKKLLQMLLENKSEFVYRHGVVTAYISKQIIRNISWGTEEQVNKVGFALFFHDIYLIPIYAKYPDAVSEEDLLFRNDISEKEKEVVLDHAKLAGQLVKTFPRCPMGVDMIVTQHHGMSGGQGFAVNYRDDISPLAKIMMVSEEVSTNILQQFNNDKEKIVINKEALAKHLSEKFRSHTYKKIIEAFLQADF